MIKFSQYGTLRTVLKGGREPERGKKEDIRQRKDRSGGKRRT